MPRQDIIVIGASAGGVEALQVLAAGLPAKLEATVFVVLHVGTGIDGQSFLPGILSKAGPLSATLATDGEQFRQNHIYIARPDCHLLLADGHTSVVSGPKENLARPAINPLFRSAAAAYGPRVAGVILTGLLDDGVAGLAEVKRRGGVALVQNPATALYPCMPAEALRYVKADYIVDLKDIAGILARLTVTERTAKEVVEPMSRKPTDMTCPECRGPIWEDRQGNIIEYRCRVGHSYSPLAFLQEHHSTLERSIWSTIVALEESAEMSEHLAGDIGRDAIEDAKAKREQAAALKEYLTKSKNEAWDI